MTPRILLPYLACLATLLIVPAAPAAPSEPDFSDLAVRWQAAMEEMRVPGMAVVVVRGDEVLYWETFGVRSTAENLPVTPESIFYIASATKPFVAMALVQLAAAGKVDLDAPVKFYLPRFQLADEETTTTLRVRDLLCHARGINSFPIVFLDAYTGEISEDRYYHFLEGVQPSGAVQYTNVHFTLAGRVVEAVSGQHWKEYLDEHIFTPAGMERTTGYADWMYAQEDVAIPTVTIGGELVPSSVRKADTTMHAAGGLGTSIYDLSLWLRLHLNGGAVGDTRVVSAEGLAEMLTMQSRLPEPDGRLRRMEGFGLGWFLGTYRDNKYAQHGGGYVGSSAHISFMPEEGIGVAVLANTDAGGQGICSVVSIDVYDRLLEDDSGYDPLPGFQSQLDRAGGGGADEPTGDNPVVAGGLSLPVDTYLGAYSNEHWGTVKVALNENGLAGRMGNLRLALFSLGQDRIRAWSPGALDAEGSFEIEGDEAVALVLEVDGAAGEVRFDRR